MAHPPPYPKSGDDAPRAAPGDTSAGPPRWMAVLGIILVVVLLALVVVLHLTGVVGPGAS